MKQETHQMHDSSAKWDLEKEVKASSDWLNSRSADVSEWKCCMLLRVCRDWIGFSSQQALEVLIHVEPLALTLYSSAFDTWANLLRSLCFALL